MIVVIFISARAHMQYLRCSLVIYACSRVVSQCNGERCLCAIKVNVLPLSFVTPPCPPLIKGKTERTR